jgi:hypothetical protein
MEFLEGFVSKKKKEGGFSITLTSLQIQLNPSK